MASKRIAGITIELGADTTKLNKALSDVDKTIRTTSNSLRDINKLLQLNPGNTELLTQKQKALSTEIDATKQRLNELKNVERESLTPEQWDNLQREIIETETKLKELENEYKEFGSVSVQQIQAAGEKLQDVGGKISTFGDKLKGIGSNLTTHVSLPLAAVGAAGVKSFAEVDKTMSLTNSTMQNSEKEAKLLNDAMKDAAANSTFGMKDAAEATLNFARAGLDAQQAADTLAPAMNLAAGEGGNLDTVSAGLVATINGFHDSFSNSAQYADVFAAACNNSALDVDGLSNAMSVAAPVFSAAGYSVNDAALYMGVMANNGIEADKAANSLKTGLSRLVDPSKQGAEWMKTLGLEVTNADGSMKDSVQVQAELHDAFAQLSESEQIAAASAIFGKNQMAPWLALINSAPEDVDSLATELVGASFSIDDFGKKLGEHGISMEDVKKNLEALGVSEEDFSDILKVSGGDIDFVMRNLQAFAKEGTTTDDVIKALGGDVGEFEAAMGETVGTTDAMAEAMMSGFGGSLEKLKSSIDVAVTSLGEALAPTIQKVADAIQGVVDWFNSLDEGQQQTIAKIGLVIAAIGPALAIVGTVIGAIGSVVSVIGTVLSAGAGLIGGIGAVVAALGPVGLAIGAAVAVGVLLYKNWETIKEKASEIWDGVKNAVSMAWDGIKSAVEEKANAVKDAAINIWNNIKEGTTNIINSIKTTVSNVWNGIKNVFSTVGNAIKTVVTTLWNGYKTLITTEINAIKTVVTTVWNGIKTVFSTVGNAIKTVLTTLWNGYKTLITTEINAIKTVITTVWNAIKTVVTTVGNGIKTVIQTAWNGYKTIVTTVGNAIKSVVTTAWNGIKSSIVNIVGTLKSALQTKWNEIKTAAKNAFSVSNFVDLGKNIVSGIISGIGKSASELFTKLKNLAKDALQAAKDKLKVDSPSKVFRDEVGKWIPEGMAVGIEANTDSVMKAVDDMSGVAIDSFTTPNSALAGTNNSTVNYGGVNITVNAKDGQSARDIAREVSNILNTQVLQQRAVFA